MPSAADRDEPQHQVWPVDIPENAGELCLKATKGD